MPEEVQMAARFTITRAGIGGPYAETIACVAVANYLCSRAVGHRWDAHNVAAPPERDLSATWESMPGC